MKLRLHNANKNISHSQQYFDPICKIEKNSYSYSKLEALSLSGPKQTQEFDYKSYPHLNKTKKVATDKKQKESFDSTQMTLNTFSPRANYTNVLFKISEESSLKKIKKKSGENSEKKDSVQNAKNGVVQKRAPQRSRSPHFRKISLSPHPNKIQFVDQQSGDVKVQTYDQFIAEQKSIQEQTENHYASQEQNYFQRENQRSKSHRERP